MMDNTAFIGKELPEKTITNELERIVELAGLIEKLKVARDPIEIEAICIDLNRKSRKIYRENRGVK